MSGDVLRLKKARHFGEDGKSWFEIKAAVGTVMVAVIVGSEELADPAAEFDFVAAMAKLGYLPRAENLELERLRALETSVRHYVSAASACEKDNAGDTRKGRLRKESEMARSELASKAFHAMRAALEPTSHLPA